ncbi:MAG: RNA polymerase sigma factor RpoH [Gammaproteobacteria bacterium]|nr:RNA polymerase sigma factor RpoH [Gammaproteobacteria bacterium]
MTQTLPVAKPVTAVLPMTMDLSSGQGLNAYIQTVNAAPVLSAEQERELATRYQEHDDLDAARQLVMSQLRHVVRVARGFMGYGLPLADLIQEGNIGLMKAVKRFDPNREVRLVSFAVHWIRAEIYDFVLRNWRIVKVATTKAQRKLFFNLRKSRARLGWMNEDEVENLADDLDVDTDTVREMESRMSGTDVPFDTSANDDDEAPAPAGYLADMRYNPERIADAESHERERGEQIHDALATLDERSRDIVARRWLSEDEKPTLHDLAAEYGVSAERIRQIEKRALGKMKDSLAA